MRTQNIIHWLFASLAALSLLASCGPEPDPRSTNKCEVSEDCDDGQSCRSNTCITSCESDSDCSEAEFGDTCRLGGICVTECSSDSDCSDGMACEQKSGTCWPEGQKVDPCENDGDCGPGEYCGENACIPAQCEDDSDCVGQAICDSDNSCRRGCRPRVDGESSPKFCAEGEECQVPGNVCESVGCENDAECGDFKVCNEDASPPACEFTDECATEGDDDARCQAWADQEDKELPHICDEAVGECIVKPQCTDDDSCDADDNIPEDEICIDNGEDERNVCQQGCRCTDASEDCVRDCRNGFICATMGEDKNTCVQGCTSNEDCTAGNEGDFCINNQCVDKCEDTDSCTTEGFTCRGDSEGRQICQPCTQDSHCAVTQECVDDAYEAEGEGENEFIGICEPLPPACPTDPYGDNHSQQNAFELMETDLPFQPMGMDKPYACADPTTNDAYMNDSGEWWKIQAGTDKIIDVEISYDTSAGNLDLALLNSTGQTLMTSDEPPSDDMGTERIVYGVNASSTFYIQVREAIRSEVKNTRYDIQVDVRDPNMCMDDGKEDNDEFGTAQDLTAGKDYTDMEVSGADKDFYRLDAKANQNVVIEAEAPNNLGQINLVLYDSNGAVIPSSEFTYKNDRKTIEYQTGSDAEKLAVEVRVVQGTGCVTYDIDWSQQDNLCTDQFEPNNTCAEAHQLSRPTQMEKVYQDLAVCTDKDWYAIDMRPLDDIHLELHYDANAQGIFDMTLRGPNVCALNAASAGSPQDVMGQPNRKKLVIDHSVAQSAGGTYYLVIEKAQGPGNQGGSLDHELRMKINPGPTCDDDSFDESGGNDTYATGTSLSKSEITSGGRDSALLGQRICDTNEDWYCTQLAQGDKVRWEVQHSEADGNIDAYIYDSSNPPMQVAKAESMTDDESISYGGMNGVQTAGKYCVKVVGASPVRNDYNLLTYVNGQGTADADCPDIYEDNDSCSGPMSCDAETLSQTQTTQGLSVCGTGAQVDPDWYKTCVDAGQTLTVETLFTHTKGNIDLYLWEEDGNFMNTFNADAKSETFNNDEKIEYYSNRDQCLYYKVDIAPGADNNYDLDVNKSQVATCTEDGVEEPNNTAQTGMQVPVPGQVTNLKKCEGDEDWYQVDLTSGNQTEIFVRHDIAEANVELELYDAAGANMPVQTGTTDNDNESITFTPQTTGTYFLKVKTAVNARLPYDILVFEDQNGNGMFDANEGPEDRTCPDMFEENDSQSEAASVGVQTYENLQMCAQNFGADNDWYSVFVPNGATLTATANFDKFPQGSNQGIEVQLHRGSGFGSQIGSTSSTDTSATGSHQNTQTGQTYHIEVTGQNGPYTKYYDLDVKLAFSGTCTDDSFSPNHTKGNAKSLSAGDYDGMNGLKLCENTEDWFTISPQNSGPATIVMDHRKALGEVGIELQDSMGNPVGTTSTMFNGNVKSIENVTLNGGDTYHLRVYAKNGSVIRNAYDLWASFGGNTPSEPNCPDQYERNDEQSSDVASKLSLSGAVTQQPMANGCGTEQDWYKVDLASGTNYQFDTFFDHDSAGDLAIEVRDSGGNLVQDGMSNDISFGNDSSDNDEQATFTPGSNATYYFGVENKNSGSKPYAFHIVDSNVYSEGSASNSCPEDSNEFNDGPGSATDLGSNFPQRLAAAACGNNDYYKWTPSKTQTATVTVMMDNDEMDLGLRVEKVTSNGLQSVGSDFGFSSKTDNRADVDVTAQSGTTYVIGVERQTKSGGSMPSNGPYFLTIE